MGGFLHALGGIAKNAWDMTIPGQRLNQQHEREQDHFNEFMSSMVNSGAKPVMAGAVNDSGVYRPPDKTRVVTSKAPGGKQYSFELATPEEQRARKVQDTIKSAMEIHKGETPMRQDEAGENLTNSTNDANMRQDVANRGHRDQRSQDLQDYGIDLPDEVGKSLGIGQGEDGQPRKFLPSEVGALSNTSSDLALAEERRKKASQTPDRKLKDAKVIEDKDGNSTLLKIYEDGVQEEVPIKAKGKGKTPTGELTPYQSWEMGHTAQKDKETRDDKQSTQLQARLTAAQKEVDGFDTKQAGLVKTIQQSEEQSKQLGEDIAAGKFAKGALAKAISDRAKLDGLAKGARADHANLEAQKQSANKRREGIIAQGKAFGDQRAGVQPQQQQPQGGSVTVGGYSFKDQKTADEFVRRAKAAGHPIQ